MWPNRQVMYRGQKYWVEAASLCPKLTKTSDWLETPYKSRSVKKQRFCFITCNVSIFLAKHLEPHIYINADFYFFFSIHRWILWWENELKSMDLQVLVGQLCSGCFCSSSLHAKRGYPAVWSKSSHQTLDKKEKSCSYFLKCLFLLSAPVENGLTVPSLPDLWKIWAAQQKCSRFRIFPSILLAINLCLNHFKADMQTVIKIPLYMTVHLTGVHRWAFLSVPLTLTSSLWLQLCVVWYRIRARRVVLYLHGTELKHGSVMRCFHPHLVNSQVCLVFSWDWTTAHSSDICYRPSVSCMYVPVKLASVRLCH